VPISAFDDCKVRYRIILDFDAMNGIFQFGSYLLLAVQKSEAVREPKRIIAGVHCNFGEVVRMISGIHTGEREFHGARKLPGI
jgi:hypothetical protein